MSNRGYNLIENYIYIHQLGVYCIIPTYPESIQDSLGSTFQTENILSRTAPLYTYSGSGPRKIQVNFDLHRDMMNDVNYDNTNFIDQLGQELNEDYVDTLIRYLQAMALPKYSAVKASDTFNKMVNPPLVTIRFGSQVWIKGVVNGDVSVTYSGPINKDNKYVQIAISFNVEEIEPQDADTLSRFGSFRGLSNILTKGIYK